MSDQRWTPHATVATLVERNGRFLMVEEWCGGKKVLNQPAGHLEPGEQLAAAACRETLEETRWHVRISAFLGIYINTAPNGVTYHRYCFIAEPICEQPEQLLDEGIVAAHWLTRSELLARQDELRSPLVLPAIDDYLAGRRLPLEVIYEHA